MQGFMSIIGFAVIVPLALAIPTQDTYANLGKRDVPGVSLYIL